MVCLIPALYYHAYRLSRVCCNEAIPPKFIMNSNLVKSCLPITYFTVNQCKDQGSNFAVRYVISIWFVNGTEWYGWTRFREIWYQHEIIISFIATAPSHGVPQRLNTLGMIHYSTKYHLVYIISDHTRNQNFSLIGIGYSMNLIPYYCFLHLLTDQNKLNNHGKNLEVRPNHIKLQIKGC